MPKGGYKAGGGRPRQANSRRSLMEKGRQAMAAVEAPEASDETSAPERGGVARAGARASKARGKHHDGGRAQTPARTRLWRSSSAMTTSLRPSEGRRRARSGPIGLAARIANTLKGSCRSIKQSTR